MTTLRRFPIVSPLPPGPLALLALVVTCTGESAPPRRVALSAGSAPLGELPSVRALIPGEARPGTRLRLTAQGSALDRVTDVRLRHREHPSLRLPVSGPLPHGNANWRAFDVQVPPGAAPGAYEFAVTIDGVVVLSSVPLLVRPATAAELTRP